MNFSNGCMLHYLRNECSFNPSLLEKPVNFWVWLNKFKKIKSHWWVSDVMLNSTKSVPIKKQTHLFAYCAQYTYSTAKIARDICNSEHIIYKKKKINSYCWIFFYKSHSEHSILNCTTSRHTTYHLNSSSSMEVCLCEYSIQKICILYSVDITMLKVSSKCAYCAQYTQLTTRHWNSELSGILNSVHRTFNFIHFKGLRLI